MEGKGGRTGEVRRRLAGYRNHHGLVPQYLLQDTISSTVNFKALLQYHITRERQLAQRDALQFGSALDCGHSRLEPVFSTQAKMHVAAPAVNGISFFG